MTKQYRKVTPEQVKAGMTAYGLHPARLAKLTGVDARRLDRFLKGDPTAELPHAVGSLLAAWAAPGALELSERYTDHATERD